MAQELPGVGVNPPPQFPVIEGPPGPPGPATMTEGATFPENPVAPWMHYDSSTGLWFFWLQSHEIWASMITADAFGFGRNWINDTYMRNMFGEVMAADYGYISRLDRLLVLATWSAADTSTDGSYELRIDGVPQITVPFTAGEIGGAQIILDQEVGIGVASLFLNGRARDPTVRFMAQFFIRP